MASLVMRKLREMVLSTLGKGAAWGQRNAVATGENETLPGFSIDPCDPLQLSQASAAAFMQLSDFGSQKLPPFFMI